MRKEENVKTRLALLVLVATLVTAVAAAVTAPAAQAQTVPGTTCSVGTTTIPCTLELVGFAGGGGNLRAIFELTNELTGQVTRVSFMTARAVQYGDRLHVDDAAAPARQHLVQLALCEE